VLVVDYSLATKTDGTLWAWGSNTNGQLGQSNQTYCSSPVQIPGTTWSVISAGNYHSLATKTDNTMVMGVMVCWKIRTK
jgi:alpha-tubulin suppressor-like RCC1 family protein